MKKILNPILLIFWLMSLDITASVVPPDNFPVIHSYIHDTSAIGEGKIFLAVATEVEGIGYHLMILNNDGSVYKFRDDFFG